MKDGSGHIREENDWEKPAGSSSGITFKAAAKNEAAKSGTHFAGMSDHSLRFTQHPCAS